MSIFHRLFGLFRGPPSRTPEESSAAVAQTVAQARSRVRACLEIEPTANPGASWLGGAPTLDPQTPWPPHRSDSALDFLAQLDLAAVRAAGGPDWLPPEGRLMFFYDLDDPGDDPTHWRIIHEVGPAPPPRRPPEVKRRVRVFPRKDVRFLPGWSFHPADDPAADFTDAEYEMFRAELGVPSRQPAHKIGGYPDVIQNEEMEAECALAAGDADVDQETAAATWRLLLQIDSDPDLDLEWGDGGMVYFWVREEDARRGDFSRAHAIWQCY